jgi:hypothetical protein
MTWGLKWSEQTQGSSHLMKREHIRCSGSALKEKGHRWHDPLSATDEPLRVIRTLEVHNQVMFCRLR